MRSVSNRTVVFFFFNIYGNFLIIFYGVIRKIRTVSLFAGKAHEIILTQYSEDEIIGLYHTSARIVYGLG